MVTKQSRTSRKVWSTDEKNAAAIRVLTGQLRVLEATKEYGIGSQQVYAWIGEAILKREAPVMAALANVTSNGDKLNLKQVLGERWLIEHGQPAHPTDMEERAILAKLLIGANPPSQGRAHKAAKT